MDSEKTSNLEAEIEKTPDDPELLLELANQYIRSKQPKRTLDTLKSAYKLVPESSELAATIGNIAVSLGEIDTAEYYFKIAAGLNPRGISSHHNLGLIYIAQKKYNMAMESFAAILKYEPKNARAHNDMGVVLCCLDQPEKALNSFRQALKYDPGYEKAFVSCCELMRELRMQSEGYRLSCEFEKNNPEIPGMANEWKIKFSKNNKSDNNSGDKPVRKSFRLDAD